MLSVILVDKSMETIKQHIAQVCQRLYGVNVEVELAIPEEKFGDYSSNIALKLAKQVGQPPRDIAQAIIAELDNASIASSEIAGPGFINMTLHASALVDEAASYRGKQKRDESIVIETNNPNPFKAMHVGHGYNSIVADAVANLLDQAYSNVHRVSYHGDVGLHVGKSMYSILRYIDGDPKKLEQLPAGERNSFMSRMYAEGSRAYAEDDSAGREIQQLAEQSFALDDPLYKQVYDICKQWSFTDIDALVERLGNKPIKKRYLESQTDPVGAAIVREHTPGVFMESDGALVFPGEKYGMFDNAFVSSRGRGLYGARDLGLMKLKRDDYQPAKSYTVTAHEQKDYFRGVIKAVELCFPDQAGVMVNIATGEVVLKGGKMSSRSGDVIEVHYLFDQIEAALSEQGVNASGEVVQGAIRYQFLKHRISSSIVFDINESITTQGNSGPYLQYAHARACSLMAKSSLNVNKDEIRQAGINDDERQLLRKVSHYASVLEQAIHDLSPHVICTYLYELSQAYNRFYEHNRVVGDEREAVRLAIVSLYRDVLHHGLSVLGIPAPERM